MIDSLDNLLSIIPIISNISSLVNDCLIIPISINIC